MAISWGETLVSLRRAIGQPSIVLPGMLLVGLVLVQPSVVLAQARSSHAGSFSVAQQEALKATSSRAAQENAIQAIPFDRLDPAARAKVAAVLTDVSLFRRLPVDVMQCDPDLYLYLLDHPDVVVNVWQALGISQVKLEQTGPETFRLTDDAGTVGAIQVLYRDQNTRVIYTDGSYNGPVFGRQLQGRILLVVRSAYIRRPDGRCYVTTRVDSFTQLDNIGVEILTKTIQPLVNKTADLNFIQTANFVASLARTAEVNQMGLVRLAKRLPHVQPEVRDGFVQLVERIGQDAASKAIDENGTAAVIADRPTGTATR
jgi:hypothetical protein